MSVSEGIEEATSKSAAFVGREGGRREKEQFTAQMNPSQ
jgi:hypothetical protein